MGVVIFDEFYECLLNVDFGLVLCFEVCEVLCEDLILLVMFVILDVELVVKLMGDVLVIIFEGCSFLVEMCWLECFICKEIWFEVVCVMLIE